MHVGAQIQASAPINTKKQVGHQAMAIQIICSLHHPGPYDCIATHIDLQVVAKH